MNEKKPGGIMSQAIALPDAAAPPDGAPTATDQAAHEAANAMPSDSADMVERVLTAAVRVLKTPQGKQQLMEAAQQPDPREAISSIAYNMMVGIDEKTGNAINEGVLQQASEAVVQMLIGLLMPDGAGAPPDATVH